MKKTAAKKTVIRFLLILAGLFLCLVVLNLLFDSGLLTSLFRKKPAPSERTPVFLFNPDYDENIFEDEAYLDLNRYIFYTEGALSVYLAGENDFAAMGPAAAFFGDYFDAVIRGDAARFNACFTAEYLAEKGEKDRFTMQQLYDIEVTKLSEYLINEDTADPITVMEFDVSYRIRRNNGTFRDDLESGAARPQVYQLYRSLTGEILIQSISEYRRR